MTVNFFAFVRKISQRKKSSHKNLKTLPTGPAGTWHVPCVKYFWKKINTNKLYYLLLMGEFIEKINKDTI
jgi:hypothetical protein